MGYVQGSARCTVVEFVRTPTTVKASTLLRCATTALAECIYTRILSRSDCCDRRCSRHANSRIVFAEVRTCCPRADLMMHTAPGIRSRLHWARLRLSLCMVLMNYCNGNSGCSLSFKCSGCLDIDCCTFEGGFAAIDYCQRHSVYS